MLKDLSSSSNIEWSMISKPLAKSAKNIRTEQFSESIASCKACIIIINASTVECPWPHIGVGKLSKTGTENIKVSKMNQVLMSNKSILPYFKRGPKWYRGNYKGKQKGSFFFLRITFGKLAS